MNWTEEEMSKIVSDAVRKALGDRDGIVVIHENCPYSIDDVAFFRRLKKAVDNTSKWIGHGIVFGILGVIFYIIKLGLDAYRSTASG